MRAYNDKSLPEIMFGVYYRAHPPKTARFTSGLAFLYMPAFFVYRYTKKSDSGHIIAHNQRQTVRTTASIDQTYKQYNLQQS